MKKNDVFELTLTSIFVALIFLMGFVPQLGFISLVPGNPITVLHVPALLAAVILSTKYAFIPGAAFGIISLIQAAINPIGLNTAFINPIVSILPRVLFVVLVHFLFKGSKHVSKLKYGNEFMLLGTAILTVIAVYSGSLAIFASLDTVWIHVIAISLILVFIVLYIYLAHKTDFKSLIVPSIFIIGTIVHTLLVLSMASLVATDLIEAFYPDKNVVETIFYVAGLNGLMEAIVAALVGTPIFLAITKLPVLQRLNKKSS